MQANISRTSELFATSRRHGKNKDSINLNQYTLRSNPFIPTFIGRSKIPSLLTEYTYTGSLILLPLHITFPSSFNKSSEEWDKKKTDITKR